MKKTDGNSPKNRIDAKGHVLVAVVGVTPSVLTTATWALAVDYGIVIDRVAVLTTKKGHAKISEQIFQNGVWDELKEDLKFRGFAIDGKLVFDPDGSVTIFKDENDRYVEDLVSSAANMRAANQMMEVLRPFSEDEQWTIHGLMAGGRKTMSALFYSCMGLLGRPCDRAYHVLVADERYLVHSLNPPFFFPQKRVVHLLSAHGRTDGKLKSTDAKINLFSVPFIPMGGWAEQRCRAMSRRLSYEAIIASVSNEIQQELYPKIEVDISGRGSVRLDGRKVKLTHYLFPIMILFLQGLGRDDVLKRIKETKLWLRLNNDGRKCVDEQCDQCPWVIKFAGDETMQGKNGVDRFGWFDLGKLESDKKCRKDMDHDLNVLRERLVGAGFPALCRIVGAEGVASDFRKEEVVWKNLDCLPKALSGKLFGRFGMRM